MRVVFGLVLVIGIGLAGFAVYMAQSYIQGYQAQLAEERKHSAPNIETVDVFVARRPLTYGEPLEKDAVRLTAFPADSLPEGVFTAIEELFPEGETVTRTVLRGIETNEAVLAMKITEPGQEAGISTQLERGMRAFAIKVDVTSGVSGFLRPGDRVDVYWTGRIDDRSARTARNSSGEVTKLIETGVRLIAVDQVANTELREAVIARTVTVSVHPEQVAALAQAQSTGRLSLSLVGAMDDSVSEAIEVDQHKLLGITAEASTIAEPQPSRKVCTIRTRRGSEVVISEIPCTN